MTDKNEYVSLLAGAPSASRKMRLMVGALTTPLLEARRTLSELRKRFDVDWAEGDQLDAIGARVGVGRYLPMALIDVYFTLDDERTGFDFGAWMGEFDPVDGMVRLGDEPYRQVIKCKILTNHWDGRRESLNALIDRMGTVFNVALAVRDWGTMHMTLYLTKATAPPLVRELFSRKILDFAPAGVGWEIVDNLPWFSFDSDTSALKGLDSGYFYSGEIHE